MFIARAGRESAELPSRITPTVRTPFICEELRSTAPFGHGSVRSVGVHQSVLVGMMFHRFFGMIGGVQRVSVGDMGVMVLGRFPVMFGRVLMMLRRLEMMFRSLVSH